MSLHPSSPLNISFLVRISHLKNQRIIGLLQATYSTSRLLGLMWHMPSTNSHSLCITQPSSDHQIGLKRLLCYLNDTLDKGLIFIKTHHPPFTPFSMSIWLVIIMTKPPLWAMLYSLVEIILLGVLRNKNPQLNLPLKPSIEQFLLLQVRFYGSITYSIKWVLNSITILLFIYCDKLSATYLSANPLLFHSKTKHLAIAFYFIHEQVQHCTLRVTHVATKDMLADFLTKPCLVHDLILTVQDQTYEILVHHAEHIGDQLNISS